MTGVLVGLASSRIELPTEMHYVLVVATSEGIISYWLMLNWIAINHVCERRRRKPGLHVPWLTVVGDVDVCTKEMELEIVRLSNSC